MGRASRWVMNLFLGKKEEKGKDKSLSEMSAGTSVAIVPRTPIYKRRWSFGRTTAKEKAHKSSKSLDLSTTKTIVLQTDADSENQQNNMTVVAATSVSVMPTKHASDGITVRVENAAATKIQAAFHTYLVLIQTHILLPKSYRRQVKMIRLFMQAKKALCALRSLVKLQALVRGHLVRKQTTTTIRCMHALMSIQVRARFQRVQMAEESASKRLSSRHTNTPLDSRSRKSHTETIGVNVHETRRVWNSKHGFLNHPDMRHIDNGLNSYFYGDLSISEQKHQYKELSFNTAHTSPNNHSKITKSISGSASFSFQQHPMSNDQSFQPNYMANTESSRSKARSQSEPKQRPNRSMKSKGNEVNGQQDEYTGPSSSRSKRFDHENHDLWLVKFYQTTQTLKDMESDVYSRVCHSNYSNNLLAYEVSF
ncbi:putative IQ-domain 19 [Tripterygium wilfordii]|uniref:Putative IQ-domain 19 n=1 Tax=Tripterygium wilfordii TaxID=458696 RepID=A0A7J7CYV2_TRIWF|nr:putative IQ-domain 19 [Tripterygium wilfordii]